jgi:protein-S-isoprenylcysteine O-methyltransferase Ste14
VALFFKNLAFTLLVPGTVGVGLPLFIAGEQLPVEGWVRGAALLVLAVGGSIYTWCVWDFASFGRGTPAPIDAPKKLVVRGLYRLTRNPMYVGVLTVILGWALLFQATVLLFYVLVVASCFQAFVVLYEEPALAREFDAEYPAYRARVRRWLPRISRNAGSGTIGGGEC